MAASGTLPTFADSGIDMSEYRLTFAEEFEDPLARVPNKNFTTHYETWGGLRTLVGNEEKQTYVDRTMLDGMEFSKTDPFRFDGETLVISARRAGEALGDRLGLPYVSGLVSTDNRFTQLYGYFEVRFLPPTGRGLWPAVWMVADTHDEHLEIDLYEMLGHDPGTFYASLHAELRPYAMHERLTDDSVGAFRTVGVEWGPDRIDWYMNGQLVASADAALDVPMYLIVNLAVGGSWGGDPDETTEFPAELVVDYIRIYQHISRLEEGSDEDR